jgi:hypothetical protein
MQLEQADVLGRSRIGRAIQKSSEPLAPDPFGCASLTRYDATS